jgi:dimethylhistidine N-methyltransferase
MTTDNLRTIDLRPADDDFLADVLRGLTSTPKFLQPKYCYDGQGSQYFDEICALDDYYVTRSEMRLLASIDEVSLGRGGKVAVIELGGASSDKFHHLLRFLPDVDLYIPIDISRDSLFNSAKQLAIDVPTLNVVAICADYEQMADISWAELLEGRTPVLFYPGSTLGNLPQAEAKVLLQTMRGVVGDHGYFLLGCDLEKDPSIILGAYDDCKGANARFNLNILHRINAELGGNFNPAAFRHDVRFNPKASQIEIYLTSLIDQVVKVKDHVIELAAGESIHAEISRKFRRSELAELAVSTGFCPLQCWTDEAFQFAIMLWSAKRSDAHQTADVNRLSTDKGGL